MGTRFPKAAMVKISIMNQSLELYMKNGNHSSHLSVGKHPEEKELRGKRTKREVGKDSF